MSVAYLATSMKWGKWALLVGVFVAMVSMWLMLKASKAEQMALNGRLENALSANQVSQASINTLTDEKNQVNQLLVDRARKYNKVEGKLNADIKTLRTELAGYECYQQPWPSDVIDRLREPY